MRFFYLTIIFFSFYNLTAQQSYIDSISKEITSLSSQQQLSEILKIPYEKYVGNLKESENLIRFGKDLAIELNDSLSLAEIYMKLAQISAYKDKREEKIAQSLMAIKIYEQLGEDVKAGVAYGELGYIIKLENMEKALQYMRKSISLLEKTDEPDIINPIYDNYGVLQFMEKEYDSALYYHNKSLLLKKSLNDLNGLGFSYAHFATAHTALENFDIAKTYIDSSTVIRKKLKDDYGIAVNYTHRADIFKAEEDYKTAIKNYKTSAELALHGNFGYLRKYCLEQITNCYLSLNDYKNAFDFNQLYQTLKDSTLNEQTNNRVAELQIEFETEKKEKEIAQQKEAILEQQLKIKNKNLIALILIGSLLILSLIIYFIYKKKQRLATELELKDALATAQTQNRLQEQRLRISRDLHDNIGSQLTFIISSIDNLKFLSKSKDQKFVNKLSQINDFASNTISQLRDTIWAMNKNIISIEDFHSRVLSLIEKAKAATENVSIQLINSLKNPYEFDAAVGINCFRVIQESINNAVKYANASKIEVEFTENKEQLIIRISDNGIGFNIEQVELGNGLENMQHRIEEVNGKLEINSFVGEGTSITIEIEKNT